MFFSKKNKTPEQPLNPMRSLSSPSEENTEPHAEGSLFAPIINPTPAAIDFGFSTNWMSLSDPSNEHLAETSGFNTVQTLDSPAAHLNQEIKRSSSWDALLSQPIDSHPVNSGLETASFASSKTISEYPPYSSDSLEDILLEPFAPEGLEDLPFLPYSQEFLEDDGALGAYFPDSIEDEGAFGAFASESIKDYATLDAFATESLDVDETQSFWAELDSVDTKSDPLHSVSHSSASLLDDIFSQDVVNDLPSTSQSSNLLDDISSLSLSSRENKSPSSQSLEDPSHNTTQGNWSVSMPELSHPENEEIEQGWESPSLRWDTEESPVEKAHGFEVDDGPNDDLIWNNLFNQDTKPGEQVSLDSAAVLDHLNDQLYPSDPLSLDSMRAEYQRPEIPLASAGWDPVALNQELIQGEQAFEEAAQYLFPETMHNSMDWESGFISSKYTSANSELQSEKDEFSAGSSAETGRLHSETETLNWYPDSNHPSNQPLVQNELTQQTQIAEQNQLGEDEESWDPPPIVQNTLPFGEEVFSSVLPHMTSPSTIPAAPTLPTPETPDDFYATDFTVNEAGELIPLYAQGSSDSNISEKHDTAIKPVNPIILSQGKAEALEAPIKIPLDTPLATPLETSVEPSFVANRESPQKEVLDSPVNGVALATTQPDNHLPSVSEEETSPFQDRIMKPVYKPILLGNLEVISICPLTPEKRLLVVFGQDVFALMGQSGIENPQVYVLKIFDYNPIAYQNTFTATPDNRTESPGCYIVQVGLWHAIISSFQDKMILHQELG